MNKWPVLFIPAYLVFVTVPGRRAQAYDHSVFNQILDRYVDDRGNVDYKAVRQNAAVDLEAYVSGLGEATISEWSKRQKLAFYINAYNAFTIKLIVDHYPVASIRRIGGLSGISGNGQWKKAMWRMAGKTVSLDQIEHEFIRPMGDPRIHFAIVCASVSCPSLARKAFTEDNIDDLLDEQARRFNRDPKGVRIFSSQKFLRKTYHIQLSSIYDWFEDDFLKMDMDLLGFVARYADAGTREFIHKHRGELRIRYMDYDWNLNDQK